MNFATPPNLLPRLEAAGHLVTRLEPLEQRAIHEGFYAVEPALKALREELRGTPLWLPQIPAADGGQGLSVLEHGLLTEVLGRSPLGHYVANCQAPDAGNMEVLLEYGSEAQKDTFLKPLLAGETRSCFGMTEPGRAGSNPVWLETQAVLDGDAWVLDGRKWFTTAADGAAFCIVMAVTDPDAPPHQRASMILVPTDAPGFRRERNIPIMGEAGDGWMSHAEVSLEGVRVPKDNLLGARGHGFSIAQARLGPGRIHHCMRWIGICRRALEMMATRAASRMLTPHESLGERQAVAHWIAECSAEIEAARLLVLDAAWSIDEVGAKAARQKISMIKFFASDVLMKVIDRAIQVHGALGITDDLVLSWFYRHERGSRIYDGPDEVHKSVVARRILKEARQA
ncbi:MAG: acyl-CoA dehydrogenase family protein [Nannocystaceae bacterium]|nr:acyl-CoA dehydrogenase family protein [bacterium]